MQDIEIINEMIVRNLNSIISFLAVRDIEQLSRLEISNKYRVDRADLMILLANSDLGTVEQAVKAYKDGIAKKLMFVGGVGHSTEYIRDNIKKHAIYNELQVDGETEARMIKEIAVKYLQIDETEILLEDKSTHCGSNASEALKIIKEKNMQIKKIILMQDPTMQLRTYASFVKIWMDRQVKFINFAPSIPLVKNNNGNIAFVDKAMDNVWDMNRFISLVMGEMLRLPDTTDGYGPKGKDYIIHIDIPERITEAHMRLIPCFNNILKLREIKK